MALKRFILGGSLLLAVIACKEVQLGGPVPGADISIDLLNQPGASYQAPHTSNRGDVVEELGILAWGEMDSAERFLRVGNFEVDPALVDSGQLYLVRVSGGEDTDSDMNGRYDRAPREIEGAWHAIVPGRLLLQSGIFINALTEAAFHYVRADIGFVSDRELQTRLNEFARLVVGDVNGDGRVTYKDVLKWSRLYSEHHYLGDITLVDTLIDTISSNARDFVREAAAESVWRKEVVEGRPPSNLGATVIGGNVDGDMVLGRDMSPYAIEATMVIDGDLTIEAGVEIRGRGNSVTIYGDLKTGGIPRQRAAIEDVDFFVNSLGSSSGTVIRYTDFEEGSLTAKIQQFTFEDNSTGDWRLEVRNAKAVEGSAASIRRNVFEDTRITFYNRLPTRPEFTLDFINNLFPNSEASTSRLVSRWQGPVGNLTLEHNSFHPNMRILSGGSGAVLDVRHNYWGVDSSADIDFDEVIPDNNADDSDWSVSIRPFLNSPHPGTPTGS